MDCSECNGACCRFIKLNATDITDDVKEWLNNHENIEVVGNNLFIYNKCSKLTKDGRCSIYNERPFLCREFKKGDVECKIAQDMMKKS